jgi:hypothetical protein
VSGQLQHAGVVLIPFTTHCPARQKLYNPLSLFLLGVNRPLTGKWLLRVHPGYSNTTTEMMGRKILITGRRGHQNQTIGVKPRQPLLVG